MSAESEDEQQPRTYALRFTERAHRDLDAATAYFAQVASPRIAVDWREGLYQALTSLSTFPAATPAFRSNFAARCGIWSTGGQAAASPTAFYSPSAAKKKAPRKRQP